MAQKKPIIGLFVTCLVDLFRPSVGFAAIKLLEEAGFSVEVPEAQTCCGQPAYNSGANADARAIAMTVIEAFEAYDYVVAPSGSCAAMLKIHYPALFQDTPDMAKRAEDLADKTYELVSFLTDVAKIKNIDQTLNIRATYHDACSGLRELNIAKQPRQLLKTIDGLELVEMEKSDSCCGFGGTFCVKFADISNDMVTGKLAAIEATNADLVLAGDLGCLMNMAGKASRENINIKARHIAEILAGDLDVPAIGERED